MKKYDLVVAGGGLTGVAAAVSAARQGMKVLLFEQSGSLGGAMANCLVYPFMPYWTLNAETKKREFLSAGIFAEMLQRHGKYAPIQFVGDHNSCFITDYFKCVLDEILEESGAEVLYHAALYTVTREGRKITSVQLATKSGPMEFAADFFIDATGDGDLMAFSGCEFLLGRAADHLCQPMTTCFRVANVDDDLYDKQHKEIQQLYKQYQAENKIKNPRENVLMFRGMGKGIVHFNSTRVVKHDPTDPFAVSRAETLARKQIIELLEFLQSHFSAFKDCVIISSASSIGVRESRKLVGEHVLNAEELVACTKFPDSIALGNYDIDIHNPEGSGTSHYYFKPGEYYTIPYRSLLPKELDNLLVAGRCISTTHEAQASIRIMPICCCLGEAAGTAIGIAQNTGTNTHTVDVQKVQEALRAGGALID